MSVFMLCERAIGLVRGNRLDLNGSERAMLEALNYEGLTAAQAQDEAVTCARHFPFIRDKLLTLYPWVFARKTTPPAQLASPTPGWKYAYAWPSDCLKPLALVAVPEWPEWARVKEWPLSTGAEQLAHFESVGRTLCCNHKAIQLRYTAKITDDSQWDAIFTDIFCSMLAGEAIASVIGEPQAIQLMDQRAQAGILEAHRTGAISQNTGLPISHILSRHITCRRLVWFPALLSPLSGHCTALLVYHTSSQPGCR